MAAIKIRMLKNVFYRLPAGPGAVLKCGKIYFATSSKNGGISGICKNGDEMWVHPGEFEFVEAPERLLKLWGRYFPLTEIYRPLSNPKPKPTQRD